MRLPALGTLVSTALLAATMASAQSAPTTVFIEAVEDEQGLIAPELLPAVREVATSVERDKALRVVTSRATADVVLLVGPLESTNAPVSAAPESVHGRLLAPVPGTRVTLHSTLLVGELTQTKAGLGRSTESAARDLGTLWRAWLTTNRYRAPSPTPVR